MSFVPTISFIAFPAPSALVHSVFPLGGDPKVPKWLTDMTSYIYTRETLGKKIK